MPDPAEYPGSPSLSVEARAKVQQTFRHTLELARGGRNEEALLGCDFILKMDSRFVPARKLLEALRGVASGTVIDLSAFEEAPAAPAPAAPAPAAAAPARPPEPPPTPPRGIPAPPVAPPVAAAPVPAAPAPPPGLAAPAQGPEAATAFSGLGFDEFASVDPFATPAAAPAPPASPAPQPAPPGPAAFAAAAPLPGPAAFPSDPFAAAPALPPNPFAAPEAVPSFPAAAGDLGFGSPALPDPFATAAPAPQDLGFAAPAAFAPDLPPAEPPAQAAFAPSAPAPAPPSGPTPPDPRITQFLRQGDDAMSRGQIQEAIDLWSRVFLIDLSNEEASRRIDAAREKQSQTAQAIDALLSEGIQFFDSGDLDSARAKFLDVLALSETDGTARHYLNQIDASISARAAAAAPAAAPAPAAPAYDDFAAPSPRPVDLGESEYAYEPQVPAEAPRLEEEEVPAAAPARKGGLDARVLIGVGLVVLVGIGFGAYKLLQPKPEAPPPPAAAPAPVKPVPAGEDPISKAQGLFDQGKVDEALQLLVSVPDADPRHAEVLAMIDRIKSSAIPTPPAAAPSDATLDEMRVTGLAAVAASRYIDAVKALDPVVKARPDDTEAAQGLAKAREELAALSAAIRAYNEQDYGSSIKLLWDLRKRDMKNQDVEEFLFKSYFNEGIQSLQAGNFKGATTSFQEASQLRPQDTEAKRHAAFARKYSGGTTDLLSRVYVKNLQMRP